MRTLTGAGILLALAALTGCGGNGVPPATVELLDFHQRDATGVFLNESLVFHFSGDLDRASVTRGSVSITDARGRDVPGTLAVDGSRVTFSPALPRDPDLTDGGFLPGSTYHVALTGFPFPDGVRGRDGEPLMSSKRFRFRTVPFTDDEDAAMFAPPLDETPTILGVVSTQIGPVDPIVLVAGAALDPRSIDPEVFALVDGTSPEPLPLRATLVENDADGARVELRVQGPSRGHLRAHEPGSWYILSIADGKRPPRNLGGIPVQPAWVVSRLGGARIDVRSRLVTRGVNFDAPRIWTGEAGSEPVDVQVARNLGTDPLWSVQPLPQVDGTAYWGDGAVSIRYPAAAGDGSAGAVALDEVDAAGLRDLHATRLRLDPERSVELPAEGLVVLRSQGAMHLAGAIRRPASAEPPPPMVFPAGETLSEWLARARTENPAWTVLIAGGDLHVERGPRDAGGLDLAGPVLFVAGGRLRIADTVRGGALWRLSPGDADELASPELRWVPSAIDWSLPIDERFRVDQPVTNPLIEPLRFGVQSASFRPPAGVATWRPGRFEADAGSGRARIRWVGQRFTSQGFEEYGPVDDVLLLAGSDAIRFTIELTVPAGPEGGADPEGAPENAGMWDPPKVEYVELRWDAPLPGASSER